MGPACFLWKYVTYFDNHDSYTDVSTAFFCVNFMATAALDSVVKWQNDKLILRTRYEILLYTKVRGVRRLGISLPRHRWAQPNAFASTYRYHKEGRNTASVQVCHHSKVARCLRRHPLANAR